MEKKRKKENNKNVDMETQCRQVDTFNFVHNTHNYGGH